MVIFFFFFFKNKKQKKSKVTMKPVCPTPKVEKVLVPYPLSGIVGTLWLAMTSQDSAVAARQQWTAMSLAAAVVVQDMVGNMDIWSCWCCCRWTR